MRERSYTDLRQELMQLYQDKAYARAFELVKKEQTSFPDDSQEISYWRISLAALLDRKEEALHMLQESLDRGEWFPPIWMESDSDLATLRPLPVFQTMLETCRQRLTQLQSEARPALLVRQPVEQTTALPLLIALHGNGHNMHRIVDYWSEIMAQGWLLALPQSSQLIGPEAFVWDNHEIGTSEVCAHLVALNNEYSIDPERVLLGGHSRGGGQAIWMALHQSIKTPGFVVLAPYLLEEELATLSALLDTQRPAGLRGTILVGAEDTECLAISRKVSEIMHAHDLPCELEIYPGLDHTYPRDFVAWITRGLAFVEQA